MGAAGVARKNTLVVDFSVLPNRLNPAEVHKFLKDQVNLDMASVKNLQLHTIRNQALIEMCSLDAAESLVSLHNMKHSLTVEKKKFIIPIFLEDMAVNVRVHDLPPDLSNATVAEHMMKFGRVKSVVRELWKKYFPGTPNGVRVVRIELEQHIPSYIQIGTDKSLVTYRKQIITCLHCGRRAHPKMKCSEAASEDKTQNPPAGPSQGNQQHVQASPVQSEDKNNEADNNIDTAGDTKRKRVRSPDKQLTEAIDMEISTDDPNVDENTLSREEWFVYTTKKLDRIIQSNRVNAEKFDKLNLKLKK